MLKKIIGIAIVTVAIFLLLSLVGRTSPAPSCATDAISRAEPLLKFHFGAEERTAIDKNAKEMPEIRNPVDPKQTFKVYEVWGYIYKGRYRMRFIYYAPADCTLMGQEILEYARL